MKKFQLVIMFVLFSILAFGQNVDSLDLEMKKIQIELKRKEIEMKQQELIIKQQEFEMLKEATIEKKEEKKELKTAKVKKEKTEAEKEADKKTRLSKSTIITFKPIALVVGGFDVGIEKRIGNRTGLKLFAGYYYSESVSIRGNYNYFEYFADAFENKAILTDNNSVEQIKVEGILRFYLSPKATGLNGLYVGPSVQYKQMKRDDKFAAYFATPYQYSYYDYFTNSTVTKTDYLYNIKYFDKESIAQTVSVGITMGYQVAYSPIAVDFSFTAGLALPINEYNNKLFNIPVIQNYNKGARPRLGFGVGIPF